MIGTHHVAGGSQEFFREAQDCYERFDPSIPPGLRLRGSTEIPVDSADLDRSSRFEPPVFRRDE